MNERSFAIILSNDYSLLFKMHGNRANIALFEKDDVIDLFRSNIEADYKVRLSGLDREIDWSFRNFEQHQQNLAEIYFTFGKIVWKYLKSPGFESQPIQQKWEIIQQIRLQLENPVFYVTELEHVPVLSLLKFGDIIKTCGDPIIASNDFFYRYTQVFAITRERNDVLSSLRTQLQSSKNFYKKNEEKLRELRQDNSYKIWADLIMANLHHIKPNTGNITVENFYNNNVPLEIKLRKELSPQKNAEIYYRKSKNQQIEIDRLDQALKAKETEILHLEEKIDIIAESDNLKTIRKIHSELNKEPGSKKQTPALPYHEFIMSGFKIWVGRNAESNDVLTLKLGYKEDLWLHAKDVSGSHVLIKYQAGKKFPKDVIERAAQLAAYNSKRKNDTLCPVILTPKKYVRKRKGDPAGAVVVEREDVIMVEPKL